MPTKHIDDSLWRKIEQETVKAVIATRYAIKDTDVLKIVIKKGLEHVEEEDYEKFIKSKKQDKSK